MMGNPDDDTGHIVGRILGDSGGKDGVFPQLKGINRGQFRAFESQVARAAQKKGTVDIELNFIYGSGGTQPTSINYDVYHQGHKIL